MFQNCSYVSLSDSLMNWHYIKLISPNQVCYAHVGNCSVIFPSLFRPMSFLSYFLPCPVDGGGVTEQLCRHLVASQSQPQ